MMKNEVETIVERKQAWVRPQLDRLEAGSAESQRAGNLDGSGQQLS